MLSEREVGRVLERIIKKLPDGVRLHQIGDGLRFAIVFPTRIREFELENLTEQGIKLAVSNIIGDRHAISSQAVS